ncbi:hypothetical protein [Cellulomonas marina]|uniref:Uncharacterized protein n=1 Tax=Cellulomonas marina TaxID=988821 RepID=A0A1I0Y2D2_9CELL|nr:hypothetical protein [Cellulomonas marina]GIG28416.1 hypothetical protein Cma02nite_10160 [Cellulomonas marina]SFB06816.1 hypothetical protein SAMN05421867_106104 [Cellulomonas marina]
MTRTADAARDRVRDLAAGLGLGHGAGHGEGRARAAAGTRQDPLISSDQGLAAWLVSIPVVIVLGTALLAPWP